MDANGVQHDGGVQDQKPSQSAPFRKRTGSLSEPASESISETMAGRSCFSGIAVEDILPTAKNAVLEHGGAIHP